MRHSRWTTGRTLVGIAELVLALIGAVPAGIPHGKRPDLGANPPQTHGKPTAKVAERGVKIGSLSCSRTPETDGSLASLGSLGYAASPYLDSEARNEGRRRAKTAFAGSERGSKRYLGAGGGVVGQGMA